MCAVARAQAGNTALHNAAYAGWAEGVTLRDCLAQVKEAAESVLEHPVKVTLLAERWDPKDAGLAW